MKKIKKYRYHPLRRRLGRELKSERSKYLVIFLFLTLMIGMISGVYVANNSMKQALKQAKIEYQAEDGHFRLQAEATGPLLEKVQNGEQPIRLYPNFYRETTEDSDGETATVRVYRKTDEINLASILEGRLPETDDEVAIDRMHADNRQISVGMVIRIDGLDYRVSGLLAYVNYSTLHQKSTDFMFDALTFDVAMMTDAGFSRLRAPLQYQYSWQYVNRPANKVSEKNIAEALVKDVFKEAMLSGNRLQDFVPALSNPAMNFAPDDLGQDQAMAGVLLYILIAVVAFIFSLIISSTITKEATVIGTLRASGYTKAELIRHFMALPLLVTMGAALTGNILGYTWFKSAVVDMYYHSYSLPTYRTLWNADAFVATTVIPLFLMLLINFLVLWYKLRLSPLRFLRRELRRRLRKKALRLPPLSFPARFRLRILLDNLPNYLVLILGIFFIMTMLAMATGMPDTLNDYQKNAPQMVVAPYQYLLKTTEGGQAQLDEPTAEPFAMTGMLLQDREREENILLYGLEPDSRYLALEAMTADEVVVSQSFARKYGLAIGEQVTVKEQYGDEIHHFTVKQIVDRSPAPAIFMSLDRYRQLLKLGAAVIGGYLSERELTEIAPEQILTLISKRDVTKSVDQLNHSMGSYMVYFQYSCIGLSAVLLFLLTKLMIEKNQPAISMTKILGYSNQELGSLYIRATTIVVMAATVGMAFSGAALMRRLWVRVLMRMDGYLDFHMTGPAYLKMMLFVAFGYLIVMFFDVRRIKKISPAEALKSAE
ncbi:MAG: FtsX-like permease family protein [Lachnospiraceae bacterium]|nr:ABC transporter permease [Lachnospiraceae bacterium]MDY5742538.1 FtsX-like permease family protein [Lachnospiraceae bacterium]